LHLTQPAHFKNKLATGNGMSNALEIYGP
jgi:hypothetical protein